MLLRTHEKNKKYLRNLSSFNNRNVRIIDRYRENLLIEYTIRNQNQSSIITHKYKYIRVKDTSTEKYVFLSVPNTMSRCKEAIAWTFSMSTKEYELFFET